MHLLQELLLKADNIVILQQVIHNYVDLIINMEVYARTQIILALDHIMLNHIVILCANILSMVFLPLLEIQSIHLRADALMLVQAADAMKHLVLPVEFK